MPTTRPPETDNRRNTVPEGLNTHINGHWSDALNRLGECQHRQIEIGKSIFLLLPADVLDLEEANLLEKDLIRTWRWIFGDAMRRRQEFVATYQGARAHYPSGLGRIAFEQGADCRMGAGRQAVDDTSGAPLTAIARLPAFGRGGRLIEGSKGSSRFGSVLGILSNNALQCRSNFGFLLARRWTALRKRTVADSECKY